MTGFCGFVFTSATGARSRFTPTARRSVAIAAAICSVSSTSSTTPSAAFPGYELPGPRLQPRDVAAFLVDPDENVVPLGAQGRGQQTQLLRALDVPPEEDDAAQTLLEPAPHPVGQPRALEPREDAGTSRAARALDSSRRAHPLTEPAVSPKAILRCTSRKKTTTGIAVSVDAAISAPQSVFRLVPAK